MQENAYLVLGCFGREESGFVLCPSVENRILKLDDTLDGLEEMLAYFEGVSLFDKPMLNNNAIRHLIYNLQEKYDQKIRRLWTESQYNLLERFMLMHKSCGLYAKLVLVSEDEELTKPSEPKPILVKGIPEPEPRDPPNLTVIRGRK